MDVVALGSLFARLLNAVLWSIYIARIARSHQPVTHEMTRQLIGVVLLFAVWAMAFGGFATLGVVEVTWTRGAYNVYAAFAAIVAIALLTGREE